MPRQESRTAKEAKRPRTTRKKPSQASAAFHKENPMLQVDEQINRIKGLYQQLTGSEPPATDNTYAPIPPEVDPEVFVRENLQRLEQAVHGLGAVPAAQQAATTPTLTPPVNVWENDKEWLCSIDLPGVQKDQISLTAIHGALRLEAPRHVPGNNGHRVVHMDAVACRFVRQLPLPTFVKADTIEAKLEAGVLHVRVQKDADATHRTVEVPVA